MRKKKKKLLSYFYPVSIGILCAIIIVLALCIYQFNSRISALASWVFLPSENGGLEIKKTPVYSFLRSFPIEKTMPGELISFTEIFSGNSWKDDKKSSVYQNYESAIISFSPKYDFYAISSPLVPDSGKKKTEKFNFQKLGEKLGFKIDKAAKVGDFWLLANLEESGGNYYMNVYAYNGEKVEKVAGEDFYVSEYPVNSQKIILGGVADDFLAGFYGPESKLIRFIKKKKPHIARPVYSAWDVSFWFDSKFARIEEIDFLKTEKGYLFYSKKGGLFLMVEENFPISLARTFRLNKFKDIEVALVSENVFQITAYSAERSSPRFFKFEFSGFNNSERASFYSSNLLDGFPERKVISACIVEYLGFNGGCGWEFYFSANGGESWVLTPEGKMVDFLASKHISSPSNDLRWRIDLIPGDKGDYNDCASPFLHKVRMSYAIK